MLSQLAMRYDVCLKIICNHLKKMRYIRVVSKEIGVAINMDTSYWDRNFSLMVIKDSFQNKIIEV